MRRSRRGGGEGWVFLLVAILILLGGAAGLVVWGRMIAARAAEQARANQRESAAAESKVVQSMRDAERQSRGNEPAELETPPPRAEGASGATAAPVPEGPAEAGRAVELARLIGRAVSAADTPARVDEAKKLVQGAAAELDSGRLGKDDVAALSTLRMAIGGAYRSLGEPARAVPYLQAATAEREKRLGARNPDAIRARMELEDAQRAAAGAK